MIISLFLLLIGGEQISIAQVYLQIEKSNSLKTFKFYEGDLIHFRTVEYPKVWRKSTLDQILFEHKTFILGGELYKIEDIKDIRISRPQWALIGKRLTQAGITYSVFAAIVQLTGLYELDTENYIIAGTAVGIGVLLQKLFRWRKFKLGKKYRLRLMDLRFQIPVESN